MLVTEETSERTAAAAEERAETGVSGLWAACEYGSSVADDADRKKHVSFSPTWKVCEANSKTFPAEVLCI